MYIFLIPVIITTNGSCAQSLKFLLSIFLIRQTTDLPIFVYVSGGIYILQLMLSFCVRVVKCSLPAVVIAQCYHSGLRRMRSYCLLICRQHEIISRLELLMNTIRTKIIVALNFIHKNHSCSRTMWPRPGARTNFFIRVVEPPY